MRATSLGLLAAASTLGLSAAHADEILIKDFYGTVELELSGSSDITVAKSGPEASSVSIRGGSDKIIDGGTEINRKRWHREYQNQRRGWRGQQKRDQDPVFEDMLQKRPTVTISAPVGTDIIVEGSAVKFTVSGGDAGRVEITDNIHLLAKLGDFALGELAVHGRGYMEAGDVAGDFQGSVHGSGDLYVGDIGRAQVSVHGSGDMKVEDVNGPLQASVHGSGDLTIGNVAGSLQASVHGSGDLDIEDVAGSGEANVHGSGDLEISSIASGLESSVHGSGDLSVGRVNGNIDASVHGSGELDIDRGEANSVDATVSGSGEFRFGGTSKTAKLKSGNAGSIRMGEVTGKMQVSGKDIRVGGKKVGGKDD